MRQSPPKELRPNCLLTRYPICFVHGIKSIFNLDYWHGIPEYLFNHGYQTYVLNGSWRGPNETRVDQFALQFGEILKTHDKVHVIAHSLGALNMLELLNRPGLENKFSSVTFVSPPFEGSPWAELGRIGQIGPIDLFRSTNETLTQESATQIFNEFRPPKNVLLGTISSHVTNHPVNPKLAIQHKSLTFYLKRRHKPSENDGLVPLYSQLKGLQWGMHFLEFQGDHEQVIGGGFWPKNLKTAHEHYLDHSISLAEHDFTASK